MYYDRILLLVPHPDDEVVGCCAAIGRARAAGANVSALYLTNGVPARDALWPWDRKYHAERVARRWREAEAAADVLGLQVLERRNLSSRSLRYHIGDSLRAVRAAIHQSNAQAIWVPAYEGGHADHDVANFIASLLQDQTSVWEFAEYNNAGGRTNSQTFCQPAQLEQTLELSPEEVALKRKALALYASERNNLAHIRTEHERFRPLSDYDYSRPPHEGSLFYARFHWVPFRHPRIDFTRPADVSSAITEFGETLPR